MIRVLLVDDQALVRSGLRMLCDSADDIEVVGEASCGASAVRRTLAERPSVVLMDLRMPGVDGIEATRRITDSAPRTKVVVLTTFDDDEHLFPALRAGACGFLGKDSSPPRILDAIRRAAAGDSPFGPDVLRRVVRRATGDRDTADESAAALTPREREVVRLVGSGATNQEIAVALHLGITTVKSYLATAMTKTGARNRVLLAVYAVRNGLA
ncbi:response regulator transcription factor [Nocardia bovistercoris]|uniref:Response regulator transcription factor n=1 Tax=Nocardia bovistercoris TaxID=2785916 RepID=A0A931N691_9NOCA|nr:response regulator transcription factor [Nocardia bovistercoris]MBH0780246.1 response regulator transcription factor [Nocardia bovistercoris]